MESTMKGTKKLWKPPSFEDFNIESQCKRMKLDETLPETVGEEIDISVDIEPKTVDELATHPKKIEEVRNWFQKTKSVKAPILLITGPAGSAKTVTLKVVASSLGVSIREWVNPVDKTDYGNDGTPQDKSEFVDSRQTDKFEDFVFRASRYKSLFDESESVILVEDFPNVFVWKPKLFFEFLERYKVVGKSPIVFICTDDQNLRLSVDLFPVSIKTKFNISEIKFNSVNQTSLLRTLKKAAGSYVEKKAVSLETLQTLVQTCNGDLRNALSSLQILVATSKRTQKEKSIRGRGKAQSQQSEVISLKDSKLEFYQAIGRVLYPKTTDKNCGKSDNENSQFTHSITDIANNFSDTFLMLLHENYVNTFSDFRSVTEAAEVFSLCDMYLSESELKEYGGLISVTGLMLSNKEPKREGFKPIKKSSAPSTSETDVWMKRFENSRFNATARTLTLDILPYLKVLNVRARNKDAGNGDSQYDDGIVIEDFDDDSND